jgi:hypothetical protein
MEVTAEMIAELRGSRYPEEILQKMNPEAKSNIIHSETKNPDA